MKTKLWVSSLAAVLFWTLSISAHAAPETIAEGADNPWSMGIGGGAIFYEGDEAVKNGLNAHLRVNYNYSPRWTLRGELFVFPQLKARKVYNYSTGTPELRKGLDGSSTWAGGLAGDVLFHLLANPACRWDPYLIGGIGLLHYEKSRAWRCQTDIPLRAGLGMACHLTPSCALQADIMWHMTSDKQEFNFIPSAGITWSPGGARVANAPGASPVILPVTATVKPEGEQDQTAEIPEDTGDLRVFEVDMNYAAGQTQVSPEYFMLLDSIAKIIQETQNCHVIVEGHADQLPDMTDEQLRRLTEKRAQAIQGYFIKKHGIPKKRVSAVGLGAARTKYAGKGSTENRRMIIRLRPEEN